MEIAVIGNGEFILGFRLAGIRKTYAAENDEKLTEHITSVISRIMAAENLKDNPSPRLNSGCGSEDIIDCIKSV